jgi:hypothetical protein
MATYWITFRIKEVVIGGREYSARYDALVEAVRAVCGDHWWYEPTSFWLISSTATREQIAARIRAAIAPAHDLALLGSMEHTGATVIGSVKELATLRALVPSLATA